MGLCELVYALRFHGRVERAGPDGNVLRTAAIAPGFSIESSCGADEPRTTWRENRQDIAALEADLILTGARTFQESGTITFEPGSHGLHFSTVGSGYFDPAATVHLQLGGALCRVERGTGRFADASGLIVSIFVVSDTGEATIHHLGVICLV